MRPTSPIVSVMSPAVAVDGASSPGLFAHGRTETGGTRGTLQLLAQAADGSRHAIDLDGDDPAIALRHAASRGWQVLSIANGEGPSTSGARMAPRGFPLILFSQELLALLDAGLNLTEALTTLHAKERQPGPRTLMAEMLRHLREGRNFSDVLRLWPEQFPEVYAATIKAAEQTGALPQALGRYIVYELQFEAIRKKLVSASIYPVLLLIVGGFVTLFLLGYVVPRFSSVYESSGREMPWLSSLLLAFGKAINSHWTLTLGGVVSAAAVLGWLFSRQAGRASLLRSVLRLPWLSTKAEEFQLARFYRAASLLLSAGIALPRALGMVTGLLSPAQQIRLGEARLAVEQGQSLSAALIASRLASPVAESLIRVGERSGQLADMLERTARFQDEDFARWIDWFSRLLEPVLMAAIGLVVGAVVVLMYIPIFDLAGSLQ